MSDVRAKFNRRCANERCRQGDYRGRRKMTDQDVVCRFCYKRLPEPIRRGLWRYDTDTRDVYAGRVALALNWLDENPE